MSILVRSLPALLGVFLLAGCGTQSRVQPSYSAASFQASSCSDTAELVFSRSGDFMYMALSAVIKIDGSEIVRLSRNQQVSQSICAGNRSIAIEASMNPGSSVISGNFVKGGKYRFIIGPNSSSFMTGAIQLSAISGTSNNSGLFGISLSEAVLPESAPAVEKQPVSNSPVRVKIDLKTAKAECSLLGYKLGTDKHADCVLELIK